MGVKNIFFDANVFIDIFDQNRSSFAKSSEAFLGALRRGIKIHTSCDVVTTIYYITAKSISKEKVLEGIKLLKTSVSILPFGEKELTQTVDIMRKDADYTDLEDTIQYILALNAKCEVIVTNDKRYVSKEIECLSAEAFVQKYLNDGR